MLYNITKEDFEDDFSKMVFENRKEFFETNDWKYLLKIVAKSYNKMQDALKINLNQEELKKFEDFLNSDKKIIIFGCGFYGNKCYQVVSNYKNKEIIGFCDNNKNLTKHRGYPVYRIDEIIKNYRECTVIIPKGDYENEMYNQLVDNGFPVENIQMFDFNLWLYNNLEYRDDLEEIFLDQNNEFVLYGTGHHEFLFSLLLKKSGVKIKAVCKEENVDYKEDNMYDIPIIEFSELKEKYKDCYVISQLYNKKLLEEYLKKEQLIFLFQLDFLQYFDKEIIKSEVNKKQSFIDAGCFDMGTAKQFMKWSGEYCDKIYSFEPDKANYEICESILNQNPKLKEKVKLYKEGLWDKTTTLYFNSVSISGASYVDETNCPNAILHDMDCVSVDKIECSSIDDVLNGKEVTFIKMDVEGSELKALQGAEKTIKKYHPILAISIYHKPEDIVEIPSYIKQIVPDYKIYIRCYHMDHTETLLYAYC